MVLWGQWLAIWWWGGAAVGSGVEAPPAPESVLANEPRCVAKVLAEKGQTRLVQYFYVHSGHKATEPIWLIQGASPNTDRLIKAKRIACFMTSDRDKDVAAHFSQEWVSWHDNGQKHSVAVYVNGKLNGPYRLWDEHGVLVAEYAYRDGEWLAD